MTALSRVTLASAGLPCSEAGKHKSYIVWFAANSAVITYNAALNRSAYQSSVYTDHRGSYSADLANDGSRETNAVKNDKAQCVHSTPETNPWWAVDLGGPTTIYRVDFTNRNGSGT